MRAWIRVLDAPDCYEHAAPAEKRSALQGSGLVRTVGSCAQRRMPQAIARGRDALSNDRRKSAVRFEMTAEQALMLATEPRAKQEARSVFVIPVNSPVATFEQSENITIAHLVGARAVACSEGVAPAIIDTDSKFIPLPSEHAHGSNGRSCTGRTLFVHRLTSLWFVSMYC